LRQPYEPDDDWKMTVNLLAVIAALLVLGAGVWLIFELDRARKAQDCLSSTMRACRQIRM
jgi:hypothetical protein